MALLRALREAGTEVRAFKKGPDYIDAAWLSWASGAPARNLDSWLMGFPRVVQSFCAHATADGINMVEGNRGLFDGVDVAGTHSTAELAKAIQAPVLLVLNVTKMTRTAAAVVLGCQQLDPDLRIAGVILNHVASKRHETVLRDAIERVCGIPVVGVIPKLDSRRAARSGTSGSSLPKIIPAVKELPAVLDKIAARLDLARIREIAAGVNALCAPDLLPPSRSRATSAPAPKREGWHRGRGQDRRGSRCRVQLLLPGKYRGAEPGRRGGRVHLRLAARANCPRMWMPCTSAAAFPRCTPRSSKPMPGFCVRLPNGATRGLPVYAECGGLMLLSRSIQWQGRRFRMAGVLPIDIEVGSAPQATDTWRWRWTRPIRFTRLEPCCAVMSFITRASRSPRREFRGAGVRAAGNRVFGAPRNRRDRQARRTDRQQRLGKLYASACKRNAGMGGGRDRTCPAASRAGRRIGIWTAGSPQGQSAFGWLDGVAKPGTFKALFRNPLLRERSISDRNYRKHESRALKRDGCSLA